MILFTEDSQTNMDLKVLLFGALLCHAAVVSILMEIFKNKYSFNLTYNAFYMSSSLLISRAYILLLILVPTEMRRSYWQLLADWEIESCLEPSVVTPTAAIPTVSPWDRPTRYSKRPRNYPPSMESTVPRAGAHQLITRKPTSSSA